ncbi:SRPBCC family protein [Olleya sp. 1-3]|uniref:SRPBCC family protein n=1 Tax=Olleya sp. 1-3 TaxID=2058323 RepID=UPI000C3444EE|nr:SRPBCC family protein [Olleya sp. 1-3]PKG51500.1 transcription activator effector-binding protein [Olleya sp. 1-3]
MKYIKYLLFLLLIAIIAIAIYVAVQPNDYTVTRSKTIQAPASLIYNEVIDFKNWEDWNAWIEEKPEMTITYPEQTKGIDGAYSWTDNGETGTMTTTDNNPNKSITQVMQFGDYPSSNVIWNFKPNPDGSTAVKWTISGKDLPFGFKAYSAFSGGMDKQIGPYYERSLDLLDRKVTESMKQHSITINGVTEHGGGFYVYTTTSSKMETFKGKMEQMFPKLKQYFKDNNITPSGAPFVIYHKWDLENNAVMFSCAMPTADRIITSQDDILTGQLEPFSALKTTLKGNYSHLEKAWNTAMSYQTDNNLVADKTGVTLEVYVTDPTNTPNPSDWITEIYLPILIENNTTLSN